MGLVSLVGMLYGLISIDAAASIPININATLISRNTDGTLNTRNKKLARQDCQSGGPFPVPEIEGYLPNKTDIPKFVTPNMANQQHQITYHAVDAKVIVNYVDPIQQDKLRPQVILDKGTIDGKYQITTPQIQDYELLNSEKLKGSITQTEQIVTLEFKKQNDQPAKDPDPNQDSELPNETESDQPDEDSKPEETLPEDYQMVTIQQVTESGKLLKQEMKSISDKQLASLLNQSWTMSGYQFKGCRYDKNSRTLKVLYSPLKIDINVIARDSLGNQLASKQVTGEFGKELTVEAPVIKGYQAIVQSQFIQINSLNPTEVVFIYEPEAADEMEVRPTDQKSKPVFSEASEPKNSEFNNDLIAKSSEQLKKVGRSKPGRATVKFRDPKKGKSQNIQKNSKRLENKLPQTSESATGWLLTALGVMGIGGVGGLKLKSR